jgi:hypothetical protein
MTDAFLLRAGEQGWVVNREPAPRLDGEPEMGIYELRRRAPALLRRTP